MTAKMNLVWTIVILLVSLAFSLLFTNIATVMSFLGATTNSAIGFLLPFIYYWKIEKHTPWNSNMKLVSYFFFCFICVSSCIKLYTLFINPN